jgi:molybdopterin biosynthesis enzyme
VATVISLSDAQRIVLDACPPLPVTNAALGDAVGLVLAADATASEDVPPFANSAVDGYAVVAADTVAAPVELTVVAELPAGAAPPADPIRRGETIRIMTGAPIPPGADAVVMVEDSERLDGGRVRLSASVEA